MAFVHLHVHTEYSALDGMIRMQDLFTVAQGHGQTAAAVTDHGTLAGMWAAQGHADDAGVKLITGQEFYLANGTRMDKVPFMVPRDDNSTDEDSERSDDSEAKLAQNVEKGLKPRPYQHLTVLAATEAGWRNLVLLNNSAQESIWHKPRIDYKLIREHAEGLIILTGCLGGPVIGPISHAQRAENEANRLDLLAGTTEATARQTGNDTDWEKARTLTDQAAQQRELAAEGREAARANIRSMIEAVGAENVYVEVMDHGIPEESDVLSQVVDLAREFGLGIVATNDAHHTHDTDATAHAAWLTVQSKSTLANPKYTFHGSGYWLKTEDEMRAVRPEPWWQEACDTTQVIADRIAQRVIPGKRDLLPRFPTPAGFKDNRDFIYHLLREGARTTYGGISKRVRDRIRTEMEVIEESGYIDYFLVVHDVVRWSLDNGILVGPGRGSAGGSLVAYLMGITRVDPLRYNLLFERFLERGRQEPPDIDIDFPQSRREDVIQYLRERWGEGNVAFIGTFQMARTKAALGDAARVLERAAVGSKLKALVPLVEAKPMPMSMLLDPENSATGDYRKLIEKADEHGHSPAREVHDLAAAFEDVIKGYGIHASGIIVSAVPLFDVVPMRRTNRGWVLQWTGPESEQAGLLKVDVLGLRNLDIVAKAVEYIEQTTGEQIDPLALPDPDQPDAADASRVANAWKVIGAGRTEGLFQLESPKMTELAQDVAPHSLNDLSALVALFRPGPMGKGLHSEYAARKRDSTLVSYRDYTPVPAEQSALASVLGDTHGLMVYQEQAMMLGTVIAGFDAPGRSKLRKAISKKKQDVMAEVGGKFLAGAPIEHHDELGNTVSIPFDESTANTVWSAMVSFASYAFNRSHSATYGYLAYITAYLKGNWPVEYAAATLAVTSGTEKRLQVLRSLRREGIEVLAPNVNAGNAFTAPAHDGAIRLGLSEVKDMGEAGIRIAEAHHRLGVDFTSISDLYERVRKPLNEDGTGGGSAITSAHVAALIQAGAMDDWGPRLGLLSIAHGAKSEPIAPLPLEWGVLERASRQRDALGLLVGTHPLVELQDQIRAYRPFTSGDWDEHKSGVAPIPITRIPDVDNATVTTIGLLSGWAEKSYSKGRMASIVIEGSKSSISGTMWDRELGEHTDASLLPAVGDIVAITGRVRFRTIDADPDDETSMAQTVKELTVSRVRVVPIVDHALDEWPASLAPSVPNLTADLDLFERAGLELSDDAPGSAEEPPVDAPTLIAVEPLPSEPTAPEPDPSPEPDGPGSGGSPLPEPSNVVPLDSARSRRTAQTAAASNSGSDNAEPIQSTFVTHQNKVSTGAPGWFVEGTDEEPGADAIYGLAPGKVLEKVDDLKPLSDGEFASLQTLIRSWQPPGARPKYSVRITHQDGFTAVLAVTRSGARSLVTA